MPVDSNIRLPPPQTAYIRHSAELAAWNHPIDLHYRTTSIQGWPKIIVQVCGPIVGFVFGFSTSPFWATVLATIQPLLLYITQVQQLDQYGRLRVVGYGFAHLPCTPGQHTISIPCWRPTGTPNEELAAFFLGTMPQLLDDDLIYHKAVKERSFLVTVPAGKVGAVRE